VLKRRLMAMFAVPLMVLGAVAVLPGPAAAAKWYCNPRCDGKDPSIYPPGGPCADDGETIYTFTYYGRTLQLRYSPNCETVWGRLYGGTPHDKVVLYREGASSVQYEYFKGRDEWTAMLDDHGVETKACLQPEWPSNVQWGCTGEF